MVLTADSTGVQGIQIVDLKERLNQEIYWMTGCLNMPWHVKYLLKLCFSVIIIKSKGKLNDKKNVKIIHPNNIERK